MSETPAIIAQGEPDKAAAISILMSLSLWDLMTSDEREAFCERGEVWDTHAGRELLQIIVAAKDVE